MIDKIPAPPIPLLSQGGLVWCDGVLPGWWWLGPDGEFIRQANPVLDAAALKQAEEKKAERAPGRQPG